MEKSIEQIKGISPDEDNIEIDYDHPDSCLSMEEIVEKMRDPNDDGHWEGRSFVWTAGGTRTEEGECMPEIRMVETFPYKTQPYRPCDRCHIQIDERIYEAFSWECSLAGKMSFEHNASFTVCTDCCDEIEDYIRGFIQKKKSMRDLA